MNKFVSHKIKAFTLIEVLIALTLSSITIALGISAYHSIINVQRQITAQRALNYELQQFYSILNYDIQDQHYAIYKQQTLSLFKNEQLNIQYFFHEEEVVRSRNEVKDTFELTAYSFEYQELRNDIPVLKDLSFAVKKKGLETRFTFTKKNSSAMSLKN